MRRRAPVPSTRTLHRRPAPLLGGRCADGAAAPLPAPGRSARTAAHDDVGVELSDHGTLWGWTTVTAPPPGYLGTVPYGFGVVELPEGLRVITRLASPVDAWTFGQPMQLRIVELGTTPTTATASPRGSSRRDRARDGSRSPASACIPFGRFDGRTVTDMGVAAVRAALADAGIGTPRRLPGRVLRHRVLGRGRGPQGARRARTAPGSRSSTSRPAARAAAPRSGWRPAAIRAGQYDTVLVFGMEKMPKGIIRSSFFEPWREEAGLAATPAYFALRAQRLMRESRASPRRTSLPSW